MFINNGRQPIKIIKAIPEGRGGKPKTPKYLSAPAFDNKPPDNIDVKPDIEPIEFRSKKFVYGEKDIEV